MIFPALFMIHEMEELIFMPKFVSSLPTSKKTKKIREYCKPLIFNLTVFEQLLLLLLILGISYYSNRFGFYVTAIIGHIAQSLVLRRYVPGLVGGVISGLICFVFLLYFGLDDYYLYLYALVTLVIIFGNILLFFRLLNKLL